jgi:hypothetical protein
MIPKPAWSVSGKKTAEALYAPAVLIFETVILFKIARSAVNRGSGADLRFGFRCVQCNQHIT